MLPANKTKIVCTIGPASEAPAIMEKMILAGMTVARLNFSHGDFSTHMQVIDNLRAVSRSVGRRIAIMADLPGPKIRIGTIVPEPIELKPGDTLTLTTLELAGNPSRVTVSFPSLPQKVKAGDTIYLNDGVIQLEVMRSDGPDVLSRVVAGGELSSRKGLNLPGIDLGISAFTERDRVCLRFALENGVDAISQSFVESAADIAAVRKAAAELGYDPLIIAKIERAGALRHLDEILGAADGLMIARGDLGVEIPIEQIAMVQKKLMRSANLAGKPVITATQMLESMTANRRPTRAEATDVANAILDGTDCVMLSAESAVGRYPVESVSMLAGIASAVEPQRPGHHVRETLRGVMHEANFGIEDLIAVSVETVMERLSSAAVIVPSTSGATAQRMTRFRLPVWIVAVCTDRTVCQKLLFSYGIHPEYEEQEPEDWNSYTRGLLRAHGIEGELAILTRGPSARRPEANFGMEVIRL